MIARLLRLIPVLLAGLLLGVGAFAALVALGVVRNPLDPVIGGDIALARSGRPGQRVLFVGNSLTYYHDMPGMVGRLAAADPGPEPLIVVSYTRGAARLSDFAGDGLYQGYAAVGSEIGAHVVPVGVAWEQAHLRQPDLGLWSWDGTHPSTAGSYLDACVFYAALTGRSPVGNPHTAGLHQGRARFLQQLADDATA